MKIVAKICNFFAQFRDYIYATIALSGTMCYICSSEIGPCSQIGIFSATREVKSQCSNNKKLLFEIVLNFQFVLKNKAVLKKLCKSAY